MAIISNAYIMILNYKYKAFKVDNSPVIAYVVEDKSEHQYYNSYVVKDANQNRFIIYVKKNINLRYGDKIEFKGEYIKPQGRRNYKGFDYEIYLRSKKILGSYKIGNEIKVVEENSLNRFYITMHNIRSKIIYNSKLILDDKSSSLYIGLILGDTKDIEDDILDDFKDSNMVHILCVSGMHISYLIMGIMFLTKKLYKKIEYAIVILVITIFMFLTNFSPSVVRAGLMAILMIIAKLIYRKNDFLTALAFSLLVLLIYNPYLITNIGVQLSFLATLGIVTFSKRISELINEKTHLKRKIAEVLSVSISAQVLILPIIVYNFNTLSFSFVISGFICSILAGAIIIYGLIVILISIILLPLARVLSTLLEILIKLLIFFSKNIAELKFLKFTVVTPNIIYIIIYYLIIFLVYWYMKKIKLGHLRRYEKRVICFFRIIKENIKIRKIVRLLIIIFIIINSLTVITPKGLKIYFIDVGQGDAILIITEMNKSILIDGGESKDTVLQYLLDRKISKLDYIIISHFDSDHVNGILEAMKELEISKIIISYQGENSENLKSFKNIVKEKKIDVIFINKGDRILIDKYTYFDVIWPDKSNLISENILNNNSIVCKLNYRKFSCIFSGDIEEMAEKKIIEEYSDNLNILNSYVLKAAHHGSNTSSTEEFIKLVKPKIVLIGAGENNKFGHPNIEVIERLKSIGAEIYRTDKMGEIIIKVNKKGEIKIRTCIQEM